MRRGGLAVLLLLAVALPSWAQAPDPVGRFVVDFRGLTSGLPTSEGWTPIVPTGTEVPGRGFGLEGGGHVYVAQWGAAKVGLGASFAKVRGTTTAVTTGTPDVETTASTLAPQLSFNFGHRLGWSHLSLGYGLAQVTAGATAVGTAPTTTAESGWVSALNFGGGARWFLTDHLGVGFDVRWHRLSGRDATAITLAAPRATLFHLAVGISLQ